MTLKMLVTPVVTGSTQALQLREFKHICIKKCLKLHCFKHSVSSISTDGKKMASRKC